MFTILWDNDGVLVDTEGLYFRATKIVLETVGVPLTADQFIDISLRRGESTLRLAAERGIAAGEIACLRAKRDETYAEFLRTEPCLVEGAEDVLRSLHGQVRMGVVSSTRRQHFEIAHARTGLTKYLDFVITHEDYQRTKPHPDPYLTALRRHRLQPQECVVVEDSERGLASAVAAGLECLIVRNEWSKEGDFRGASKVLPSIRDVPGEVVQRVCGKRAGNFPAPNAS
jgi:HAD superfamily hydrolase (TIGR01509 family)